MNDATGPTDWIASGLAGCVGAVVSTGGGVQERRERTAMESAEKVDIREKLACE
jgi:uncharacterized membrane protein